MSTQGTADRELFRLSDIPDPGSRAFTLGSGDWPLRGFVVRRGGSVAAYVNRCPHAGHPLNLRPDDFLSADQSLILCGSHGALFEMLTGACIAGPCAGRVLSVLPVAISNGCVVLRDDPEALARRYA